MAGLTYAPEFFADPHPAYARLREEAAVHHVTEPSGLKHFLVLRYAEARAALADPRLAKAWLPFPVFRGMTSLIVRGRPA